MTEQAIATVEELPAELRAELVANRQGGTTLAELKKGYPQVAPDVIRAVLPPLPKPKPAAKPKQTPAKPTQTAKAGQAKPKPSAKAQAASNGQAKPTDKAELRLAAQVVKLREDQGMSWAQIGYKLKLVPADAGKSSAGGAARRLFKLIKGADADTSRAAIAK